MKHYLGICLILITAAAIGFFALHSCTASVDQTIDHVRDAFTQALHVQPQVTVNQHVVLTQTAPIAELAVVTKEEAVTIGFNEHLEVLSLQIPMTEKKLTAQATFRIKAGFDLHEPYSVDIDPVTHQIHATMPRAKILSVEQIGDFTLHGEDATLNRVTDVDRTEIVTNLSAAARDAADKSSLKSDAEQQVTQRLNELLTHNGQLFQINWSGEGTPLPGPRP